MEYKKQKLPVGIPTFEELRTDGYVCVDKTKYLIDLIDTGKIYFLNRPDFRPSPVIHLDMSKVSTDAGIEGMKESILRKTRESVEW